MERTCQNPSCGKALERKQGERPKDWDKRKTCDQRCEKKRRKAEMWALLNTSYECAGGCGRIIKPHLDSRGRVKAPKTCRRIACAAEARRQAWVEKQAAVEQEATTTAPTWTDPAGNTHILPASIALREEYKASIKRRIKRGEGVRMIGDVRVYEGPVTRAAA